MERKTSMAGVRSHLKNDVADIDHLLYSVSEKWIEEATESGTVVDDLALEDPERNFGSSLESDFLSPVDLGKWHVSASNLPLQVVEAVEGEENDDAAAADAGTQIKSLYQLQSEILRLHPEQLEVQSRSKANLVHRCLLHFENATLPTSSPVCPTLTAVQDLLTTGALSFTVHSAEGYDFTSEFLNVYDNQGSTRTSFGDFVTICKRALVLHDSGLSDERADGYARYILRIAAWQHTIAHEACQQVVSAQLPHLAAFVTSNTHTRVYSNVKVFVGRDGASPVQPSGAVSRPTLGSGAGLCFWVRVCPRLEPQKFPRNTSKETVERESRAEEAMHFVYHRRLLLTPRLVDDFNSLEDQTTRTKRQQAPLPPPPSVPPSVHHFSIALSCRQVPLRTGAGFLALDDHGEEDEEGALAAGSVINDDGFDARSVVSGDTGVHTQNTHATHRTTASRLSHLSALTTASSTACFVLKSPSQCSELLGWGQNLFFSLGIDDDNTGGGFSSSSPSSPAGEADKDRASQGKFYAPRPVPIPPSLALERIKMIACSPRHTLLLTALGNVYCCGENSEGALGLGDLRFRAHICLLPWPIDPDAPSAPPPKIVKIAAGSASIGSHSMAIDADGRLYGWGVPYAVGHGGTKPVLSPKTIDTFPLFLDEEAHAEDDLDNPNGEGEGEGEGEGARRRGQGQAEGQEETSLKAARCRDVACGGGFTVCVLSSGAAYAWGAFAFGKLGIGPAPTIKSTRSGGGTKLARYQLRPARLHGLPKAEAVSCGEAHALCVTQSGRLYAWGQNSCGQLGVGVSPSGFLRNANRPVPVPPFAGGRAAVVVDSSGHSHSSKLRVRAASCGAYHSLVVDTRGRVWSWGARGSACLGQNDPFLEGSWAENVNKVFSISHTAPHIMVPFELLEWTQRWARPRLVPGLGVGAGGSEVVQVSAGDLHSAAVTARGHLYLWGTGSVAPPLASTSLRAEENKRSEVDAQNDEDEEDEDGSDAEAEAAEAEAGAEDKEKDEGEKAAKSHKKRLRRQRAEHHRKVERLLQKATIVTAPRRPSASWLPFLASKRTLLVASSGGRCFALQDEELVAAALTSPLLRRSMLGGAAGQSEYGDAGDDSQSVFSASKGGHLHQRHAAHHHAHSRGAADVADDASLDSFIRSEDGSNMGSFFAQRGLADCIVICSGKVLLAHRALLSARSPVLRDLIIQEMPSDDVGTGGWLQPTQVLLPELHADSARALLGFLYTDVLPQSSIGNVGQLRALSRASKSLRLPRLQVICERLLLALSTAEQATDRSENLLRASAHSLGLEIPPPTLSRDLGSLVGDQSFADVRFIAEGRSLLAHRFILEARCEYFRAMFRSGMSEAAEAPTGGAVDVVVPDTFVGFLRLLIFLYTDALPDGSDGALLEDLMSADRYNVPDMRRVVESMLVPSASNWLDLLQAAEVVRSAPLRHSVEGFLRDNFSVLASTSHPFLDAQEKTALDVLQDEFPGTLDRIFQGRRLAYPSPPSHSLAKRRETNSAIRDRLEVQKKPGPIIGAILALVGVISYGRLHSFYGVGWTVPIFNGIIFAVFIIYLFYGTFIDQIYSKKPTVREDF